MWLDKEHFSTIVTYYQNYPVASFGEMPIVCEIFSDLKGKDAYLKCKLPKGGNWIGGNSFSLLNHQTLFL